MHNPGKHFSSITVVADCKSRIVSDVSEAIYLKTTWPYNGSQIIDGTYKQLTTFEFRGVGSTSRIGPNRSDVLDVICGCLGKDSNVIQMDKGMLPLAERQYDGRCLSERPWSGP